MKTAQQGAAHSNSFTPHSSPTSPPNPPRPCCHRREEDKGHDAMERIGIWTWTMPFRYQALNHFAILYGDRMPEQTSNRRTPLA